MSNATPATPAVDPRQQSLPLDQPLRAPDDGLSPILSEILAASVQSSGLSKKSQYDLLKTQIAPGCTDDELGLFMQIARSRGFDPFSRHIYARKQRAWDSEKRDYVQKMIIITGIDAFRLKAARTKEHTGTSDAEFTVDAQKIGPLNPKGIVKVKMIVTRNGNQFPATCMWDEYAQTYKANGTEILVPMWQKMPFNQIEKCCEVKALKRGFPEEFADIFSDDEIQGGAEAKPNGTTTTPARADGASIAQTPPAPPAPTATVAATTPKPPATPTTPDWEKKAKEAETMLNAATNQAELAEAFKKLGKLLPRSAPTEIRQMIGVLYEAVRAKLPAAAPATPAAAAAPAVSAPPAAPPPVQTPADGDPENDGR
jgi:phage recombination protein Bet